MPAERKAERPGAGFLSVVNTDARADCNLRIIKNGFALREIKWAGWIIKENCIQSAVDLESLAEFAGSAGQLGGLERRLEFAITGHCFDAFNCDPGPNQDGLAVGGVAGNDVEAVVESVDEIDVGMSACPVECLGTGCFTSGKGVAGAIRGAEIGFGFDDFDDEVAIFCVVSDEIAAEKIPGNYIGGLAASVLRERLQFLVYGTSLGRHGILQIVAEPNRGES